MADLMGIGEILVEVMAEKLGQDFLSAGKFLGPYPSGAPAIAIDQAARLGANAAILSCVGDDDFGLVNTRRLAADGVDTGGIVVRGDKVTGVAFVSYKTDGSRKFIFHFKDAAAGALGPDDVKAEVLAGVKILHIMGCSLSASDSMREAVMKGARLVKQNGGKLSFDPNLRPELLGMEQIKQAFSWILKNADILLTGAEELSLLTGLDAETAAKNALRDGASIVALKSGSKGARVMTRAAERLIPSYQVEEIDPTGAGDCFDGAFLAMLLQGKTPFEAAEVANAAGAFSVTRRGPMEGAATPEDIQRIMNGRK